jgi:hypothetical protein
VEGEIRKPRLLQEWLELPMVEVIGVHRLADPVREHEAVILSKGAQAQPVPRSGERGGS